MSQGKGVKKGHSVPPGTAKFQTHLMRDVENVASNTSLFTQYTKLTPN